MLFNPFEKHFNLPAVAVKVGNCLGWNVEIVGEVDIGSVGFLVIVFDSSEFVRIIFF